MTFYKNTYHYLLNKYLSVYYVPGTIPGSGDILGNKRQSTGPISYRGCICEYKGPNWGWDGPGYLKKKKKQNKTSKTKVDEFRKITGRVRIRLYGTFQALSGLWVLQWTGRWVTGEFWARLMWSDFFLKRSFWLVNWKLT